MSSPVSSRQAGFFLLGEELAGAAVLGGVVGDASVPAAPDDSEPGSGEDAGGVLVGFAGGGVAVVDGGGPGAGSAAVGGEVDDGVAQFLVTGPAERHDVVAAGLSGGWCGAGEGGEGGFGGEPAAGVADLDQQLGGADLTAAGQRSEDVAVRVQRELFADLRLEQGDLFADRAQRLDVRHGGVGSGGGGVAGQPGGAGAETIQQHASGLAAAVAVGCQPCAEASFAQPGGRVHGGKAAQEGQADRRVEAVSYTHLTL